MKEIIQLLLLILLFTSCSNSDYAGGGGADVGNPMIVGVALTSEHEGAAEVEVYLIPSDYMARGGSIDPRYRTVTDENGNYSFEITEGVSYTLSVQTTTNNQAYSLFRRGISSDHIGIYYDILEPSVHISLQIPQELVDSKNSLSMAGLPTPLTYIQEDFQGEKVWVVKDIAQGNSAEIFMWDSNGDLEQLTDSLVLNSDSLQVVDCYTEWISYTKNNSPMNQDSVYEVFRDSRGVDWFGTFDGGLYRGDTWDQFSVSEGLQSPMILALEEDQNGVIWCGTALGVAVINGSTVTPFTVPEAPKSGVYDIFRDDNNRLWFGTDEGLYLYDQGVWSQFTMANSGLSYDMVYSITSYENSLYLGTFGGGISIFDGTIWDTLTQTNSGLESDHIYTVEFDETGELWCGTGRGISRRSGDIWETINMGNSELPDNTIWTLAVDTEGAIWAGTGAGTVRYQSGDMRIFREDNSRFNSPQSFSIYVDQATEVVLFGTGSGVTVATKF